MPSASALQPQTLQHGTAIAGRGGTNERTRANASPPAVERQTWAVAQSLRQLFGVDARAHGTGRLVLGRVGAAPRGTSRYRHRVNARRAQSRVYRRRRHARRAASLPLTLRGGTVSRQLGVNGLRPMFEGQAAWRMQQ